jgi:hypothetical protein
LNIPNYVTVLFGETIRSSPLTPVPCMNSPKFNFLTVVKVLNYFPLIHRGIKNVILFKQCCILYFRFRHNKKKQLINCSSMVINITMYINSDYFPTPNFFHVFFSSRFFIVTLMIILIDFKNKFKFRFYLIRVFFKCFRNFFYHI